MVFAPSSRPLSVFADRWVSFAPLHLQSMVVMLWDLPQTTLNGRLPRKDVQTKYTSWIKALKPWTMYVKPEFFGSIFALQHSCIQTFQFQRPTTLLGYLQNFITSSRWCDTRSMPRRTLTPVFAAPQQAHACSLNFSVASVPISAYALYVWPSGGGIVLHSYKRPRVLWGKSWLGWREWKTET